MYLVTIWRKLSIVPYFDHFYCDKEIPMILNTDVCTLGWYMWNRAGQKLSMGVMCIVLNYKYLLTTSGQWKTKKLKLINIHESSLFKSLFDMTQVIFRT